MTKQLCENGLIPQILLSLDLRYKIFLFLGLTTSRRVLMIPDLHHVKALHLKDLLFWIIKKDRGEKLTTLYKNHAHNKLL